MTQANQLIHITGIVQGVGFRPYVYGLALKYALTGWVRNTSRGVEIEVSGELDHIDQFTAYLSAFPPPLAQIDSFTSQPAPFSPFSRFEILYSVDYNADFMPVSPDIAICADCRKELFDPSDRRFRYPFINCTNCGPRFTIIHHIPYDRLNTSMSKFPLCSDCQKEYQDPLDRRFHAQPVACPVCGPKVWLELNGSQLAVEDEAIKLTRRWIKEGKIIAVKGLGGFHLACDASNPMAVQSLRNRKKRSDKPFALMAFDLKTIEHFVEVSDSARGLLMSPQAPIVLMPPLETAFDMLNLCAPGQNKLGFLLPYTPLHLLLLEPASDFPEVLVMTSANLSEEPIAYKNEQALSQLKELADAFLMHDRPIHMRVDDSVFTLLDEKPYPIRRSRGYAPNPIRLPIEIPSILGTGSLLKNTFCLTRDRYAFISHYIGDLENHETLQSYESAIKHYQDLFRITPGLIACDMHPDYLATQYAMERQRKENIPLIPVQHHHAHIAACLAENQWDSCEPVIGLSYDGTGYGTDGHIWGGEILIASYKKFQRRFHLEYVAMPGGDLAVKKPSRMAISQLTASGIELDKRLPPVSALSDMEIDAVQHQIQAGINTPLTSSMGRLFDAVAALIGIRQKVNYEGQAAIELEAIADLAELGYYSLELSEQQILTKQLFVAIARDLLNDVPVSRISAKFHQAIVNVSLEACKQIRRETSINYVAISGGVWQNLYLMSRILPELRKAGFQPLIHHQLPPNDACIALGQVMIAAHAGFI
jgi:hydrogenase maturation protein HypF